MRLPFDADGIRLRRRVRGLGVALLGAVLIAPISRAADGRDVETPASAPPLFHMPEAPPPAGPALSLLWFDPGTALPGGFATARPEVTSIFRGIGVDVRWTLGGLGTTYGGASLPEVPVILLPDDPSPARSSRHVMGLVIKEPSPTRAVWIFLRNVRWTLGHDLHRPAGQREIRELARAVARVVAHEVIHAIAPEEPHSRKGLMSHSLNRSHLLAREATLDAQCAAAFLTRLATLLPAPAAPPAAALRTY